MKLLYDITTLAHIHCARGVRPAGIVRHTEEMGLAVAARPDVDFYVSVAASQFGKAVRYLSETASFGLDRLAIPSQGADAVSAAHRAVLARDGGGGLLRPALRKYLAQSYSPARVYNPGRFDLYHVNWRGESALPQQSLPGVVLTIPDVIPLKHPEWFVKPGESNSIGEYLTTLLLSVRAHQVVTVSTESVRRDVLDLFPHIAEEQIHVTPLGVSNRFAPCTDPQRDAGVRARYGIPRDHRYILCVNTLEPRKNMLAVIEAYMGLVEDGAAEDVSLVLVGSKGWLSDDIERRCAELAQSGSGSVIVAGFVDDADMTPLYSGASAFCYPSLDEGFGLPVLEAMKAGAPVITSNVPPLLEAAGDAALTVDPKDVPALTAAMDKLLQDAELADKLRTKGVDRAAAYTWDHSAQAMLTAYEQAADLRRTRGVRQRPAGRGAMETQPGATERTRPSVPLGTQSMNEIRGRFAGERAFILGSFFDPERAPMALLADAYTFAINDFYKHRGLITWKPTFHVVARDAIDTESARGINGMTGSVFFFEDGASDLLRTGSDVTPFKFYQGSSRIEGSELLMHVRAPNVRGPERSMAAATQIAHLLGFDEIYLVGAAPVDSRSESQELRAWHFACRDALEASGRTIRNLSAGTLFEIYKRADPHALLPSRDRSEFSRDQHAHVEETQIIAQMFGSGDERPKTMIDVGAHRGTSAVYFLNKKNWTIYCYEPDPENRGHLEGRYGGRDNVTIDPRAVGSKPATGVPFFVSEESGGISGLSAFRESHEQRGVVDVTTVANIVDEHGIDHVDFLKIDVEGFDLDVLRGVPWDRIRPDVVECEYEDAKTLPLGHTLHDIAEYLRARGYTVYVSEWHPIIRYGIRHDWRRLVPYQGFNIPSNSWGNVLAFQDDPGYEAIQAAFAGTVETHEDAPFVPDREAKPTGVKMEPTKPVKPKRGRGRSHTGARRSVADLPDRPSDPVASKSTTTKRRVYADAADRLRDRLPGVYAALRLAKRGVEAAVRRFRLLTVAVVTTFVVVGGVSFVLPEGVRYGLWAATVVGLLTTAMVVVALYAYQTAQRQSDLSREARKSRRGLEDRIKRVEGRLQNQIDGMSNVPRNLPDTLRDLRRRAGQVDRLQATVTDVQSRLRNAIDDLRSSDADHDGRLEALREDLQSQAKSQGEVRRELAEVLGKSTELHQKLIDQHQQAALALARRDATSQSVREVLLLICPPRVGSTLVYDILRSHPAIEMHSSADVYQRLGLAGRRYPGHLTDVLGADRMVEVQVGLGGRILGAPSVASSGDEIRYWVEKVHPAAFDFATDNFAAQVARLRGELGGDERVTPLYLIREPAASIRSFVSYRRRSPGWHYTIPVEAAYDYYRSNYTVLTNLFEQFPGRVISYEDVVRAPAVTIGGVLLHLGLEPAEKAEEVGGALWDAVSTRPRPDTAFFTKGDARLAVADVEFGRWTDEPDRARALLSECRQLYRQLLSVGT